MKRASPQEAAFRLRQARRIVAFTGAGISEESGIPSFRSPGGIWERYPPQRFAHPLGLVAESLLRPTLVASFLREILSSCLEAKPNPAHKALARWEREGRLMAVITQNIDTLHEAAGSRELIKLHGSIDHLRCTECGFRQGFDDHQLRGWLASFSVSGKPRRQLWRGMRHILTACPYCGGRRRPDVVLFGDTLPSEAWQAAVQQASSCDLLLIIGTSGLVYPAAQVPHLARNAGAILLEIGTLPTAITPQVDLFLPGKAGEIMAQLDHLIDSNPP